MYLVSGNKSSLQGGIAFDDYDEAEEYVMSLVEESAIFLGSGDLVSYSKNVQTGGKSFKMLVLTKDTAEGFQGEEDLFVVEEMPNKMLGILPLSLHGTDGLSENQVLVSQIRRCGEQ